MTHDYRLGDREDPIPKNMGVSVIRKQLLLTSSRQNRKHSPVGALRINFKGWRAGSIVKSTD